jgi:YD repeat-containing protein
MKNTILTIVILLFGFTAKAQVTVTYTYDNLNRLTQASYSNGVGIQYSYDALGNRTQETKTSTLSVEEVTTEKNFKLYPNPFKDELYLSSDNQTIKEVSIIDMAGKLIKTIANINATHYQLDASYMVTGNYLIQIKTDEGVEVHKVIKK